MSDAEQRKEAEELDRRIRGGLQAQAEIKRDLEALLREAPAALADSQEKLQLAVDPLERAEIQAEIESLNEAMTEAREWFRGMEDAS